MGNDAKRPILVAILGILYLLMGLGLVILGIMMFMGGVVVSEDETAKTLIEFGGVPVVIMGIISLIIAGGFWNGWRVMWYIGVIFGIIGMIIMIGSLFTGFFPAIISILIDAAILYYMFRPGVKAFFRV